MASSLLVLLDDIATVLDDITVMTKVAAKKSAGVLGDDLALNAEQVSGVDPARELHVVWSVAKGSALNKVILVPSALLISWLVPKAILPLLILGGAFLCYEGIEKIAHKLLHAEDEDAEGGHAAGGHAEHAAGDVAGDAADDAAGDADGASVDGAVDGAAGTDAVEAVTGHPDPHGPDLIKQKIRGAIRTDFILSAEIVVITLGEVAGKPFVTRLGVLVAIATLMTVGVYGLVAGIVKIDDLGLALSKRSTAGAQRVGNAILVAAPWLMRFLSVAGTAAMFLVGGGILAHDIDFMEAVDKWIKATMGEGFLGTLVSMGYHAVLGVVLGLLAVALVTGVKKLLPAKSKGAGPDAGAAASP